MFRIVHGICSQELCIARNSPKLERETFFTTGVRIPSHVIKFKLFVMGGTGDSLFNIWLHMKLRNTSIVKGTASERTTAAYLFARYAIAGDYVCVSRRDIMCERYVCVARDER